MSLRILLLMLVVVLAYPLGSYERALAYPGHAGVAARTVDWLRGFGVGWVIDAVENWWYSHNTPAAGPPARTALPQHRALDTTATVRDPRPAPLTVRPGLRPLPGEGVWTPLNRTPGGHLALFGTYLRPDPVYTSVVTAVTWLDPRFAALTLTPGTKDPGGFATTDPAVGQVSQTARARLLATFNAGFLMRDAHGGWYANGRTIRPLRSGAASLVIHRDGTATVGRWGRDVTLTADVAAVRQNLDLVVDHGRTVPGLDGNRDARWGSAHSQFQYTWRSGVGVDGRGNLIYVAGDKLNLATLANALREAGAVEGMQLDIHPDMVSYNVYQPDRRTVPPVKLLPAMASPATRYLSADQRDFFTVTAR